MLTARGAAASSAAEAPASSLVPGEMRARGSIRIALLADYPPYSFFDKNGELAGIDVDMLKGLARILRLKTVFRDVAFATITPSVENGRFDIGGGGMADLAARETVVDMVDAYVTVDGFLVTSGNPTHLSKSTDLCGVSMATTVGAIEVPLAEAFSRACVKSGKAALELKVYQDSASALLALKTGRVTAIPQDIASAIYLTRHKYPGLQTAEGALPGSSSFDGYAVSRARPNLSVAVVAALREMMRSGEYRRILETWGIAAYGMTPGNLLNAAAHAAGPAVE